MRPCATQRTSPITGSWDRVKATGESEDNLERANDYEREADKELTWSVRRAMRREAVLGFITPFVTALARAHVASRRGTAASSTFFSATAVWTFLTRLLRAPSVARLRSCRFT